MVLIAMTIIIMFIVLIAWSYHNLGKMDIPRKILWIVVFLGVIFIATYVTFIISKNNIIYPNNKIMSSVKNVITLIFTGVNGCFIMPIFCKNAEAMYQENIDRTQFGKRMLWCMVALIILLIFECGYMANTQKGILQIMYQNM